MFDEPPQEGWILGRALVSRPVTGMARWRLFAESPNARSFAWVRGLMRDVVVMLDVDAKNPRLGIGRCIRARA